MISVGHDRQRGISMVEVLVSLIVVSIGLLGLAKLQAAAVGNVKDSRVRSMAALQAQSIAAAMRANRVLWASGVAPTDITIANGAVTDSSNIILANPPDCAAVSCSLVQMASYDLLNWAEHLNNRFPNSSAAITCTNSLLSTITCEIQVRWDQRTIAVNAAGPADAQSQSYTLIVNP